MAAPRAILIAGPTASGKSALAMALARRHGGLVVNADSMQVYDALRIITARPGPDEEAAVPHALYGHVPAGERYSTGRWLSDARAVLERAQADGLVPVFVGGTGLYFKALTEGIAAVPPVPDQLMQDWRAECALVGAPMAHALLAARDPDSAARIAPTDSQRIVRALSVLDATGRPLADWLSEPPEPALLALGQCDAMFLDPDRPALYERIDARFDAMLKAGALDEVARLRAQALDPSLPAMRAHGVPHLIAHLDGHIPLDVAVRRAKGDTRRYAKRQKTWFRHQMAGWRVVQPADAP